MAERKRRHGKLYLLLMALAAAGAAIWVGSSVLSVEEFAFTGARLPAGWDGGRLVVLSDLHGKRFGRQNSRLLEAVRGAKPDVICLCGDMALCAGGFGMAAVCLAVQWPLGLGEEVRAILRTEKSRRERQKSPENRNCSGHRGEN